MADKLRIKRRFGLTTSAKTKQIYTYLVRCQIVGGNEVIDGLTRLSELLRNPRSKSGESFVSLEAAKVELEAARSGLVNVFESFDDVAEHLENALEILDNVRGRGVLDQRIEEVYADISTTYTILNGPWRIVEDHRIKEREGE